MRTGYRSAQFRSVTLGCFMDQTAAGKHLSAGRHQHSYDDYEQQRSRQSSRVDRKWLRAGDLCRAALRPPARNHLVMAWFRRVALWLAYTAANGWPDQPGLDKPSPGSSSVRHG